MRDRPTDSEIALIPITQCLPATPTFQKMKIRSNRFCSSMLYKPTYFATQFKQYLTPKRPSKEDKYHYSTIPSGHKMPQTKCSSRISDNLHRRQRVRADQSVNDPVILPNRNRHESRMGSGPRPTWCDEKTIQTKTYWTKSIRCLGTWRMWKATMQPSRKR